MTTFDGRTYTFNGLGEYWMIKTVSDIGGTNITLSVQCRTEFARSLVDPNKASTATILTGFAVRAGYGMIIDVSKELIFAVELIVRIHHFSLMRGEST